MLKERLQILVSAEQRLRLEEEARLAGMSVGALVREAIDARFGTPSLADRRRAFTAVAAMRGRYVSPEEIEALGDDERDRAASAGDSS
jgi:uncharacterized protein YcfJ